MPAIRAAHTSAPAKDADEGRRAAARAHAGERDVPAGRSPQAVPELHRPRSARAGAAISSRNTSSASRSSTRTRPSIRAPTRSCACRRGGCAPGWCATTAKKAAADAIVIELPKGGYAPVFKNREAAGSGRRSLGDDARRPEHDRGAAASPITARRRTSATSADGLRQEIIHRLAKLEALRVLAVQPGGRLPQGRPGEHAGQAAMLLTGGVRKSGDRLRVTVHLVDNADRLLPLVGVGRRVGADDVRGAGGASRRRSSEKLEPRLRRRRPAPRRAAAGGEPGGPQPVPAGPLSPEPAHRRRPAQGAGLLREGDRRRRAVRARPQRAGRRAQPAGPLRRARSRRWRGPRRRRAPRRPSCSTATRPRRTRRSRTSRRRRTGTGTAPSASSSSPSSSTRATRRRTTGTRCRASCRWAASTRRSTRCGSRSRSTRCRRSSRATWPMIHAYRRDYEAALEQCDHTIELNPHFSPGLLDARHDPGTAQGSRRSDRRVPARHRSVAAQPAHARGARRARWRCRASARWRSRSLRKLEAIAKQRYVSPFEFAVGALRARPDRTWGSAG